MQSQLLIWQQGGSTVKDIGEVSSCNSMDIPFRASTSLNDKGFINIIPQEIFGKESIISKLNLPIILQSVVTSFGTRYSIKIEQMTHNDIYRYETGSPTILKLIEKAFESFIWHPFTKTAYIPVGRCNMLNLIEEELRPKITNLMPQTALKLQLIQILMCSNEFFSNPDGQLDKEDEKKEVKEPTLELMMEFVLSSRSSLKDIEYEFETLVDKCKSIKEEKENNKG